MKETTTGKWIALIGVVVALWVLAHSTDPVEKALSATFIFCTFAFLVGLELQKRGH